MHESVNFIAPQKENIEDNSRGEHATATSILKQGVHAVKPYRRKIIYLPGGKINDHLLGHSVQNMGTNAWQNFTEKIMAKIFKKKMHGKEVLHERANPLL